MQQLPVIQPGRSAPASGAPPIFDKIGIVGLGLIGGSIALAARQLWPKALVIGVDNKDVLETAMRLHAVDVAADDLVVLAEADLVILAAPVRQNLALLGQLDDHVHHAAVVTDTGVLTAAVDDAIAAKPDIAAKIRAGKTAAADALVGAVMKATGGQADAASVRELILTRLGQS